MYDDDDDERAERAEPTALDGFLDEGLLTGVIRTIKSGKEADVFLCRANERETGEHLVVAKIHRRRERRNFKDASAYLDGRFRKVTSEVRAMKLNDNVGREIAHAFWVGHEWDTLRALHAAGADVPRPIARNEGGLLMAYLGEPEAPAPQLREVDADPSEAERILGRLMWNVSVLLLANVVHADLSAYNVLWWQERPWLIDLPQAVDPRFNSSAREFLGRDVRNLCAWAKRQGLETDAGAIADDLWTAWTFADLVPEDVRAELEI